MEPIFAAYYTKDTPYEQEVKNLIKSLEEFNLDYDIQGISNLGSWDANTHYKPTFIKGMILKHNRPVVYLDADAVVCQYPKLFFELDCPYAVPEIEWSNYNRRPRKEILSGTLYFDSIDLLDQWIDACIINKKTWDQRLLAKLLPKDFTRLPEEYCVIFDLMKLNMDPIIKHYQASRRFKKKVII